MTNAAGQPDANPAAVAYGGLRHPFSELSASGLTCGMPSAASRQSRS